MSDCEILAQWFLHEFEIKLLHELSMAQLVECMRHITFAPAQAEQVLFQQGDHAKNMYFITMGSVSMWLVTYIQKKQSINN